MKSFRIDFICRSLVPTLVVMFFLRGRDKKTEKIFRIDRREIVSLDFHEVVAQKKKSGGRKRVGRRTDFS